MALPVNMTSIGETLRRERLQKGLELQQVSESTKIGTRMLQAMEQNDFSKLPGGVFTRSFVKQYAVALGLNPAAMEEQLKFLPTGIEEPVKNEGRKDVIPENKHYSLSEYNSATNSGGILISAFWVLAAMAVTGLVYYMINRPQSAAVAQAPAPIAQKTETIPAETPSAAEPVAENQPAAVAPSSSPLQVTLNATDDAWVSITADGKSQFVGVMKAGEKKDFEASQKVKLVAGNAGALDIFFNGKPIDAIGPKGQVRVVDFTPEGAHVVPRILPNPAPLP